MAEVLQLEEARLILNKGSLVGIVGFALLVGGQGTATGDIISVVNPSFEADVLAEDTWTEGDFTGWTVEWEPKVGAGVWNLPGDNASDGQNVAWSSGGVLFQNTDHALAVGTYTLDIDVAADFGEPPYYWVQLWADDHLLSEDTDYILTPRFEWFTSTVTYTANPGNPYLGQSLIIKFRGLASIQADTLFDNVRLTSDGPVVPEPSILAALTGLLGTGLIGHWWRRRRKPA